MPQWSRNGRAIWHWGFCVSSFWLDEDKSGRSYLYELNTSGLRVCLFLRIQTSSYQKDVLVHGSKFLPSRSCDMALQRLLPITKK